MEDLKRARSIIPAKVGKIDAIHRPAFPHIWLAFQAQDICRYESILIKEIKCGAKRNIDWTDFVVFEVGCLNAASIVWSNLRRIFDCFEACRPIRAVYVLEHCDCSLLQFVVRVKDDLVRHRKTEPRVTQSTSSWALGVTSSALSIISAVFIEHVAKVVFHFRATPPAVNQDVVVPHFRQYKLLLSIRSIFLLVVAYIDLLSFVVLLCEKWAAVGSRSYQGCTCLNCC